MVCNDNQNRSRTMAQKIVKLKEATQFAVNNGYLFAVYKMGDDGSYHKIENCANNPFDTPIDPEWEILVKTTGAATDFNEFTTVDKEYCFRLHNNFNVPDVIPVL